VKIKTSEATPRQLDWLVGVIEGYEMSFYGVCSMRARVPGQGVYAPWRPTYDWDQGGPIGERARIKVSPYHHMGGWWAEHAITKAVCEGQTQLIAAIRCKVASVYGDEIEIPADVLRSCSLT
jgi:hypothetical protein